MKDLEVALQLCRIAKRVQKLSTDRSGEILANQIRRVAMAFSRKEYKEHLIAKLKGASREYFKMCLANKFLPDDHKDIRHWHREYTRLLDEYEDVVCDEVKFNRIRAVRDALAEFQTLIPGIQNRARAIIVQDYELKKIRRDLTPDDTEWFLNQVRHIIEKSE